MREKRAVTPSYKREVGRPTDLSEELIELICVRVALGENLNIICQDESMPCPDTVYRWRREHKEFSEKYWRAVLDRADARSDRIDGIAREVGTGKLEPNAASVMLKAEMWQAGRENPRRYGDKQIIEHNGSLDISHYMAHDQKIIDRYNARRAGEQDPVTIDHKPAPAEE
jgi:hypothetical protein